MPLTEIQKLGLPQSAAIQATLADGTEVVLETFGCQMIWFGESREIEVTANQGRMPLLGIGLLRGRKLTVDYRSNQVTLE
jgi:predicted aspartyl protease